jgi:hypothetical protein
MRARFQIKLRTRFFVEKTRAMLRTVITNDSRVLLFLWDLQSSSLHVKENSPGGGGGGGWEVAASAGAALEEPGSDKQRQSLVVSPPSAKEPQQRFAATARKHKVRRELLRKPNTSSGACEIGQRRRITRRHKEQLKAATRLSRRSQSRQHKAHSEHQLLCSGRLRSFQFFAPNRNQPSVLTTQLYTNKCRRFELHV